MKRILVFLFLASICFGQSIPNKIGNLSKIEFEKWVKQMNFDGFKFAMFSHETDSFQTGFIKGQNTITILASLDDGSYKDDMMKKMNYTVYERKGYKHFYIAYPELSSTTILLPKYKVLFSVGLQGKSTKENLDKLIDQTKVYEK
ncbi:MAG: hypothetical protein RBS48_00440 [Ignavibacteriaceae bacterium]|jgi:hypothetical protein|nr:hypothetical protein [Ignavibacteriaceae bacterium]